MSIHCIFHTYCDRPVGFKSVGPFAAYVNACLTANDCHDLCLACTKLIIICISQSA